MTVIAPNWKTLFDAVEHGDIGAVKRIVQEGLPASTANPQGETAAHLATRKGNLDILKYLLSKDSSLLSAKDKVGQNILYLAVVKGSIHIVRYLVDDCNVDVFHDDNIRLGNSAVHVAAREGYMDIVKYFIQEKHFDVDVLNEDGEPPVFLAAGNKKLHIVKFLVEQEHAQVKLLNYNNQNILFPAAKNGDVTLPQYILDSRKVDLEIDWKDNQGRTVLHWSALSNYLKVTEYFVDVKRADVNMPDSMWRTPLHLAAQAGHIKLVEFLYETGADPELPDAEGKTPIQLAKDKKVISFLTDFPKKQERRRRSAPKLSNPAHGSLTAPPLPRRIAADIFWSQRRLIDGRTHLEQRIALSNGLESFLTLAHVYFGHSKRDGYKDIESSPMDSISQRVDPVAVDVIRGLN